MSEPPKKKKRTFREEWLKAFQWLTYCPTDGMKCSLCIKFKKNNIFVSGCLDFQNSSLTRHECSAAHKEAVKSTKQGSAFKKGIQVMESKATDSLIPQMRTAMFLAQEGMAIDKFQALLALQKTNGAPLGTTYQHHKQVEQML